MRARCPVYVERTILDLPSIYVNGGSRGLLVEIDPAHLVRVLNPTVVEVGLQQ
jgi:prolyl-tRNA editing enzyme YbaK/EbsC (Cys-tRNA(Pro) deacylase)